MKAAIFSVSAVPATYLYDGNGQTGTLDSANAGAGDGNHSSLQVATPVCNGGATGGERIGLIWTSLRDSMFRRDDCSYFIDTA